MTIDKKIRDLALIPTVPDTAVMEIDDLSPTDYKTTIAQLKTVFGGVAVPEQNIIYVGKHGSDSDAGTNIETAKLTFVGATTAASSGDVIVCFDNGTYVESLVSKAGVNIYAPNIVLDGNHAITHGNRYLFGNMIGPTSGLRFGVNAAVEVELTVARFILTAGDLGFLTAAGAKLNINAQHIEVGNTFLFADASVGESYLEFEEIIINGTGIVMGGFSSSNIHIRGSSISDTGSGTLFQTTVDTICSINCARINIQNLSNITEGTEANLISATLQGAQNEIGAGRITFVTSQITDSLALTSRIQLNQFVDDSVDVPVFNQSTSSGTRTNPLTIINGSPISQWSIYGYRSDFATPDYINYANVIFGVATGGVDIGTVSIKVNTVTAPNTVLVHNVLTATSDGDGEMMESGDSLTLAGIDLQESGNTEFNSTNKTITGSFNTTLTNTHSCGKRTGGIITDAGGINVDTSSGTGFFRIADNDLGELKELSWSASLGNAIPLGTARYIGVDYNGGAPIIIIKTSDTWTNHVDFRLGSVVNDGGVLHILNNPWRGIDPISWAIERFYETRPFERSERIGGLELGETGTRNVTVSGGELYDALNEFVIPNIDTSVLDTFDSYLGSVLSSSAIAQWDNLNYNNGGVLTALGLNQYANLWWYIEADGGLVCLYGTGQYSTSAIAQTEGIPSQIPLRIQTHGRLIGRYIFQQNAATTTLIQSAFTNDFAGTLSSDHASLSNLGYSSSNHGTGFVGFQRGTTLNTVDPTINDDTTLGYVVGDRFTNTTSDMSFILSDSTAGAAVWNKIFSPTVGTNYIVNGFTMPIADGAANQVMYTNGSGVLAFKDDAESDIWQRVGTTISPQTVGDDLQIDEIKAVGGALTVAALGETVTMSGLDYPSADGTINQVMYTNGSGVIGFRDEDSALWQRVATTLSPATPGDNMEISNIQGVAGNLTVGTLGNTIQVGGINWPTADGSTNQVMYTNGSGQLAFKDDAADAIWQKVGTTISPITAGDDLQIDEIKAVSSALTIAQTGETVTMAGLAYPSADGTPNQVLKTDGSGNLDWTTISGTALDQIRIFFVSKAGNDGFSGKSDDAPFLTIGKALTEAALLSPTFSNPVAIRIIDAGVYEENFALLPYVFLIGDQATVHGEVTYIGNSYIELYHVRSNTEHCFKSSATTGNTAIIKCNLITLTASVRSGIYHSTNFILNFVVNKISTTSNDCRGISILAARVQGNINTIEQLSGSSSSGIYVNSGASTRSNLFISGTITTLGTAIEIDSGELLLQTNELSGFNAYQQTGGILNIIVNSLIGNQIKTGGTIYLSRNDLHITRQLNHALVEERGYSSFTNNFPAALDDTEPTSTEGQQIFNTSYDTGDAPFVKLIFRLTTNLTMGVAGRLYCGLYVDSKTTPEKIGVAYQASAQTKTNPFCTGSVILPGSATYNLKVRVGSDQVAGIYVNGRAGGRDYGGATGCSLEIEEYEEI